MVVYCGQLFHQPLLLFGVEKEFSCVKYTLFSFYFWYLRIVDFIQFSPCWENGDGKFVNLRKGKTYSLNL